MNRENDTKKLKDKIEKLSKENTHLKQLSERDFLTGVYNRRKLEEDLWRYVELNKRFKIKFSILMFDINKFKEINDTKGHKTGDKILRQIAYILQENVRTYDKVYRYGGDEFIVILSHHTEMNTVLIERINNALLKINITASIGHWYICKDCLEIIDKYMYEKKRGQ
jgi:diguanylate cyclase (GGDEF)-like protein